MFHAQVISIFCLSDAVVSRRKFILVMSLISFEYRQSIFKEKIVQKGRLLDDYWTIDYFGCMVCKRNLKKLEKS